jgi:regulation of enolase protein 1 (concanavalin A-like superfamily)
MWLRVRREGSDYIVEHGSGQGPIKWHQLRMCHLMEDDGSKPVLMGLYAANPSGIYGPVPQTSGFRAIFDVWELQAGRV